MWSEKCALLELTNKALMLPRNQWNQTDKEEPILRVQSGRILRCCRQYKTTLLRKVQDRQGTSFDFPG
jgi:hypothetical protein